MKALVPSFSCNTTDGLLALPVVWRLRSCFGCVTVGALLAGDELLKTTSGSGAPGRTSPARLADTFVRFTGLTDLVISNPRITLPMATLAAFGEIRMPAVGLASH